MSLSTLNSNCRLLNSCCFSEQSALCSPHFRPIFFGVSAAVIDTSLFIIGKHKEWWAISTLKGWFGAHGNFQLFFCFFYLLNLSILISNSRYILCGLVSTETNRLQFLLKICVLTFLQLLTCKWMNFSQFALPNTGSEFLYCCLKFIIL